MDGGFEPETGNAVLRYLATINAARDHGNAQPRRSPTGPRFLLLSRWVSADTSCCYHLQSDFGLHLPARARHSFR